MLVHAESRRRRPGMWTWTTLVLLEVLCFSTIKTANWCENVLGECREDPATWTTCYEDRMFTCKPRGRRPPPGFVRMNVKTSGEAKANVTTNVRVQIPSSALQKSKGSAASEEVMVVASVLNSTLFESPPKQKGRMGSPQQPDDKPPFVLGWTVLSVRSGTNPVKNLHEPIKLTFTFDEKVDYGECVFWKEPENPKGKGEWSTDGCQTTRSGDDFICSSSHMSFFAVLVNQEMSVGEAHSRNLSYITFVGSALSVIFAFISFFIYTYLRRRGRSEKAIGIHMQLTGALLCLHLSFLLSSLWFQMLGDQEDGGWVCKGLGLVLHWSLLATLTWLALEGFHLYLLLIRVFNISVERYLLKLSVVGWGFPTLAAVACGISGVYGKYNLKLMDEGKPNSTAPICWMSSGFQHRQVVGYITVGFLCLVVLYNTCMLAMVVFKLYLIRDGPLGDKSSQWRNVKKEKGLDLWKKCAAVLILSCVLGLPWGLASTTYISLSGVYVFTILNSLQGFFMFLWSTSLLCKSHKSHKSLATKSLSSQKMMTVSTNNRSFQ